MLATLVLNSGSHLLLFVASGHWCKGTSAGLLIPPPLSPNFYMPILKHSVVSNTFPTLVPLLPHGSPSPTSTELGD